VKIEQETLPSPAGRAQRRVRNRNKSNFGRIVNRFRHDWPFWQQTHISVAGLPDDLNTVDFCKIHCLAHAIYAH